MSLDEVSAQGFGVPRVLQGSHALDPQQPFSLTRQAVIQTTLGCRVYMRWLVAVLTPVTPAHLTCTYHSP